jgi:hypothetical protein
MLVLFAVSESGAEFGWANRCVEFAPNSARYGTFNLPAGGMLPRGGRAATAAKVGLKPPEFRIFQCLYGKVSINRTQKRMLKLVWIDRCVDRRVGAWPLDDFEIV